MPPQSRHFNSPENCNRRMAGEEIIVAHVVGDEQRWKSRIPPDHIRRRRQSAERLHNLPHAKEQNQAEKGAASAEENPFRNQEQSEKVDKDRKSTRLNS